MVRGQAEARREWTPPGEGRRAVRLSSRARYLFAMSRLREGRVLDIGCGPGEGTALLASRTERSVGLDVSFEALSVASNSEGEVLFVCANAERLPFRESSFDGVVCFEMIEHLKDARPLLLAVRRVLRPDGRFLCSTPNRRVYSPAGTWLEYHEREYTRQELERLLRSVFARVELYGQRYLSRDARLDLLPFNRFLYTAKRRLDPRGVVLNRIRRLFVASFLGEREEDLGPGHFPVRSGAPEKAPILLAVCEP